jgi:hypothetical protein
MLLMQNSRLSSSLLLPVPHLDAAPTAQIMESACSESASAILCGVITFATSTFRQSVLVSLFFLLLLYI